MKALYDLFASLDSTGRAVVGGLIVVAIVVLGLYAKPEVLQAILMWLGQ